MTAPRRIVIRVRREGGFDVIENGRVADRLSFDEMMGQVVALAHPALGGRPHYRTFTGRELIENQRRHRQRLMERN